MGLLYALVEWRILRGAALSLHPPWWWLVSIPLAALAPLWVLTNLPLPLLYVGWFLLFNLRLLLGTKRRRRFALLWNLLPLLTCGVHLALLGAFSLALRKTPGAVLLSPHLRIASLSAALALLLVSLVFLTGKEAQIELFDAMADSAEVRSFLGFLLAAFVFLMMDSVLASLANAAGAAPLFLLSGNGLLVVLLLRYPLRLYQILKTQWRGLQFSNLQTEVELRDRRSCKLWKLVYTDVLTGAFSRQYAMEQMAELMAQNVPFSLVFLDLDRLKQVNDYAGHRAGDSYLCQFVQAFGGELRGDDTLARIGGDEFLVLMVDCAQSTTCQRIAAIRRQMDAAKGRAHPFSFSFGVTFLPPGGRKDPETLLQEADRAMYQDKQRLRHP